LQLRNQDENNIVRISIVGVVCVILVTDNAVGAQTERQGDAGPVIPHRLPFFRFTVPTRLFWPFRVS
jgi:hypothetical protein